MNLREIIDVPIDDIKAQILERTPTDQGILELASSIKQIGIIEPLIVLKADDEYILQAGKRRLLAARQAGLPTVPCIVVEVDQTQSFAITLHENLYRENLNPVDEAYIYQQLRDRHRYSGKEIAAMIGRKEGYVSQRLQIILWPDNLVEALATESISFSVARELSIITDTKHRNWLLKHAIESGVNYRTARRWRIEWQSQPQAPDTEPDYTKPPEPEQPLEQPQVLCWWCGKFHPTNHMITIQLCHSDFSALQFSKEKVSGDQS